MLQTDPPFRPVRTRDGYLPLEDLGLIGDGSTVALAGLDGSINWLCLPRFDSAPLLCGLLDRKGRVFTYSAAMCQVALDRAAAIGERLGLPGQAQGWRAAADKLRQVIIDQSWDEGAQTLSEHLDGGGGLDASLLALPLRQVLPADHPRMIATTAAIAKRLSAGGGLLYRYLHGDSPDGIAGDEGAFVLCSFWLVDNLAMQGRLEEAAELYASLCDRASPLGLLSEQIDPSTGEFAGNFPQAFSHIGIVASGVTLARAETKAKANATPNAKATPNAAADTNANTGAKP